MNQAKRESKQNELFQRTVDIFLYDYERSAQEMNEALELLDNHGYGLASAMLGYQHALILDRLLLIADDSPVGH